MRMPKIYFLCGLLCDKTIWQRIIRAMDIPYDIRIFDFYAFNDITAMAESVLHADDGPFILVGHSMGARVALEAARLAPRRLIKLALLDTGIHAVKNGEAEKRYALLEAAKQHGMAYLVTNWLLPMLAETNRHHTELIRPLADMVLRTNTEIFARQIRALLNRPDAASALAAVDCPVLLGVGREDEWSPVEQHEAMQRIAPHAQLHVFPDCGHMAPFEQAALVGKVLQQWLLK